MLVLFLPVTKFPLLCTVTAGGIKVKGYHRAGSDMAQEVGHLTCEIFDYICIVGEILKTSVGSAAGNKFLIHFTNL